MKAMVKVIILERLREAGLLDGYLAYLDRVREQDERMSMFGAGPLLMAEYGLTKSEANAVLMRWLSSRRWATRKVD